MLEFSEDFRRFLESNETVDKVFQTFSTISEDDEDDPKIFTNSPANISTWMCAQEKHILTLTENR